VVDCDPGLACSFRRLPDRIWPHIDDVAIGAITSPSEIISAPSLRPRCVPGGLQRRLAHDAHDT
jgi:hypothetical protein